MRPLLILLLLTIMTAQVAYRPVYTWDDKFQLVVVVTFGHLKPDVELLLCSGVVYPLVPSNVDPHDYQLKPSDIELLKRASVIISTGHAHFELEIRDLVERGELKAKLVDILSIPGIKVLTNPVTEQPNYHLPVRDPVNYLVFMGVLVRVLTEIDPINRNCYYSKFYDLVEKLAEGILTYGSRFSGNVIVDSPHVQYYVEWLGFKTAWIVEPEEGVQATPESIRKIEELIRSKSIIAVFVTRPKISPGSRLLVELAEEYKVPIVEVHGPASDVGVYNSLLDVLMQVKELNLATTSKLKPVAGSEYAQLAYLHYAVLIMLSFIVGFIVGVLVRKVKRW